MVDAFDFVPVEVASGEMVVASRGTDERPGRPVHRLESHFGTTMLRSRTWDVVCAGALATLADRERFVAGEVASFTLGVVSNGSECVLVPLAALRQYPRIERLLAGRGVSIAATSFASLVVSDGGVMLETGYGPAMSLLSVSAVVTREDEASSARFLADRARRRDQLHLDRSAEVSARVTQIRSSLDAGFLAAEVLSVLGR